VKIKNRKLRLKDLTKYVLQFNDFDSLVIIIINLKREIVIHGYVLTITKYE